MNKHLYGENMINNTTIEIVNEAINKAVLMIYNQTQAGNLRDPSRENYNQHILDIAKMLVEVEMSRNETKHT